MPRPLIYIPPIAANRRRKHPSTWVLLAVVLAALACLGSLACEPEERYGVGGLGDGALVIDTGEPALVSADGGSNWQPIYTIESGERIWAPNVDENWRSAVQWGVGEVATPRGRYAIEVEEKEISGVRAISYIGIVRIEGYSREVVYSPSHLQDPAARRFRARQRAAYEPSSSTAKNIVYHASTGNIVAVLGSEGVVVGDAAGNWRPLLAEVGAREVDVSIRNRIAFSIAEVWLAAITVAIASTAAVLAFTFVSEVRGRRAEWANVSHLTIGSFFLGPLILILLIVIYWVVLPKDLFSIQIYFFNAIISGLGVVAVWRKNHPWFKLTSLVASAAVPLIVAVALISLTGLFGYPNLSLRYVLICVSSIIAAAGAVAIWIKMRALVGASVLLIASVIAALMLFSAHSVYSGGLDDFIFLALSPFSLIAFVSFASYFVRQLHVVFAALVGMAALIALAFAIDAALAFYIWPAKVCAIILVLAVARFLIGHLRNSQRPHQPQ